MIDSDTDPERPNAGEAQAAEPAALHLDAGFDLPLSVRVARDATERCAATDTWFDRYRRGSAGRF